MIKKYEVTLKRKDGSVRILVEYPESGRPWRVSVYRRPKRARLWCDVVDWHSYEMRQLAVGARGIAARAKILEVVSLDEILVAIQHAWDLYRPTLETVERAMLR